MSVKHTPGPWSCDEDPMGPEILTIIADAAKPTYDWKIVAQLSADDDSDIPPHIARANARLIASAPEMFAILKSARAMKAPTQAWLDDTFAIIAKVEDGE